MWIVWRAYGFLFWSWWRRLLVKQQWAAWRYTDGWVPNRLVPYYWWHLWRDKSRHGWRYGKVVAWITCWLDGFLCANLSGYWCPHCGHDFDLCEEPWFECTNAGQYSTQDGTTRWWEGIQTCPRCRHKWEYRDST